MLCRIRSGDMCRSRIGGASVRLRVCISQLLAAAHLGTLRADLWIAWNLLYPRLDAHTVGVSNENTASPVASKRLAFSLSTFACVQREAGHIATT